MCVQDLVFTRGQSESPQIVYAVTLSGRSCQEEQNKQQQRQQEKSSSRHIFKKKIERKGVTFKDILLCV
jgi:hypothetical protein